VANHSLSSRDLNASPPDWPASGRIRPLLSSRIEWKAKGLARRWRHRFAARRQQAFDLDAVYQVAGSNRPEIRPGALSRALRSAAAPSEAIDVSFAALALAIAARHRSRIEGLVAFLELCYSASDRDAGVSGMGERLRRTGAAAPGSPLAGLEYDAGWPTLAAGIRQLTPSMAPPAPRIERGPGRGLGPRRVVVRLSGGLGNQLFQYAAALAYARRIGAPLRLDLAVYEQRADVREFLLGRLRIPVHQASSFEVLWTRRRPHFETRGAFDDFLFGDHGSVWFSGFWEDYAYFADIAPTLRRRFRPRNEAVADAARELVQRAHMGDGPVVGVHLRRGDRGPGGRAYAPFSTLPASYYRQAASRFPAGANFLVFSDTPDDIAWCRDNIGLGDGAGVSFGEGRDPILDIFALAQCDHVILSSGTFSWWAGYLGERPGRRVVAPNPLQGLSVERVMLPPPLPLQPGWEELTLAPP
jgi:hypothetical protein